MSYGGTPAALEQQQRPLMVDVGAGLLALGGAVSVGRVAYGVVVNLGLDDWDSGARAVFLVLNGIVLAFSLLLLVLAYQVWRGRPWAWITSLVILPFTILYGGLLLLVTVVNGAVPWAGAGVAGAALAALMVLTVPRTVRGYFQRKPIPTATQAPGSQEPMYPPA